MLLKDSITTEEIIKQQRFQLHCSPLSSSNQAWQVRQSSNKKGDFNGKHTFTNDGFSESHVQVPKGTGFC